VLEKWVPMVLERFEEVAVAYMYGVCAGLYCWCCVTLYQCLTSCNVWSGSWMEAGLCVWGNISSTRSPVIFRIRSVMGSEMYILTL
jgi:hypothetical protein